MSARPPSPDDFLEGENEVQRNIRLKVCAYCKKPGARLKCKACFQRTYCNKKCQKRDWKTVHREQCETLQQVFVPSAAGWREAVEVAEREGGGGGGAAAAGGGGGGCAAADDDDDFQHPCPICLDNEDDAYVDGVTPVQCTACGQIYCGGCNAEVGSTGKCPTCRAPLRISAKEHFKRLWKLVHDRSPGRHTPPAQFSLGAMYADGDGVKQDDKEAFTWYIKAAEQGYAPAQYTLGQTYSNGNGVEQDFKEAVKWYRKAAEQGVAAAQFNLGNKYNNGQGVKQDHKEAVTWYRKAAKQGYANAQFNLGFMYANGQGVKQDHKEAVTWYRKAAEQGDAVARYNLGVAYLKSHGVKQDFAKALKWFQMASEQGEESALSCLDLLQQCNGIPTPPPGTSVTAVLLTSATGSKYNSRTGIVLAPTDGTPVKPGRVAVLLEGAETPISFKLMNLRV